MTEIREKDFNAFFQTPFDAYGADTLYVSPLKSDLKNALDLDKNPVFQGDSTLTYFTAHQNGLVVGRITTHVHTESNQAFNQSQAYFGFFDCIDDQGVANMLLSRAEDWAHMRGYTSLSGNYNLTAMQQVGVMTSGFEHAPYTDQLYSPPHIHTLLEHAGYEPEFPMTTFQTPLSISDPIPDLTSKHEAILSDPDFAFAPINRRTLPARLEDARLILNASFADNPQFVPVTQEEYAFQAKDMKWIMDPRISMVLHYKSKPAACIICIPDQNPLLKKVRSRLGVAFPYHFLKNRFSRKRAVLIYAGVIPALQSKGINPLLMYKVRQAMIGAGYEICGNTWIGDENPASLRQREKAGAHFLHRLHIYRKMLETSA